MLIINCESSINVTQKIIMLAIWYMKNNGKVRKIIWSLEPNAANSAELKFYHFIVQKLNDYIKMDIACSYLVNPKGWFLWNSIICFFEYEWRSWWRLF